MTDKSSFGYRHLRKKGWNDGTGLGKANSGDVNPIKVNLKHDTAGLGHDMSKDFTNQWWDHVFNKAAAKVSVTAEGSEVKVKSSELSEENKAKLKYKTLYGKFVKGTRLEQGVETHEERDDDSSEEDRKPAISILTDEQLLNACGGRTAHKGARHGFTMNGKLARVEQQEFSSSNQLGSTDPNESRARQTKKKKHKKSRMSSPQAEEEPEELKPAKKKKRDKTSSKHHLCSSEQNAGEDKCSDKEEAITNGLVDDLVGVTEVEGTKLKKQKKRKKKYESSRKDDGT